MKKFIVSEPKKTATYVCLIIEVVFLFWVWTNLPKQVTFEQQFWVPKDHRFTDEVNGVELDIVNHSIPPGAYYVEFDSFKKSAQGQKVNLYVQEFTNPLTSSLRVHYSMRINGLDYISSLDFKKNADSVIWNSKGEVIFEGFRYDEAVDLTIVSIFVVFCLMLVLSHILSFINRPWTSIPR